MVADPLGDLATENGTLSVWEVGDDRSNLDRLLAALAANRDYLANVDYVVFDQRHLRRVGIEIRQSVGDTPDEGVNALWHRDLCHVSGHRLVQLTQAILKTGQTERRNREEVRHLLRRAVQAGMVSVGRLRPSVAAEIARATGR